MEIEDRQGEVLKGYVLIRVAQTGLVLYKRRFKSPFARYLKLVEFKKKYSQELKSGKYLLSILWD